MIYMPNCEWSNDPLPSQPATHLAVAILFNFTNNLATREGIQSPIRQLMTPRDDLKPLYLNTQGFRVGKSGEA